ncbi:hypothetical protein AUTU_25610 [Aureibacter tunicatorum]|nr:hypothetical protein AUTU_25610 [Aureibacter tunicatorum]
MTEKIISKDIFLKKLNVIYMDKSMGWVEKNSAIMDLINERDKLIRKRNTEVCKILLLRGDNKRENLFDLN